jgi:hypothetical protein
VTGSALEGVWYPIWNLEKLVEDYPHIAEISLPV